MQVASLSFVCLCFVGLISFHATSSRLCRHAVLALVSIALVAGRLPICEDFWIRTVPSLAPLLLFVLWGYASLGLVRKGRIAFAAVLVSVIALFFLLRHANVIRIFDLPHATTGLAYIVFRILGIAIDYRNNDEEPRIGLREYLYHMFAFYTFLSGPLLSFREHENALKDIATRDLDDNEAYANYSRLITGFVKVVVVTQLLSLSTDRVFNMLMTSDTGDIAWPALFFAAETMLFFIKLYANFSGYMDIVIGLAGLFHIRLPENFNRPLEARSIFAFWKSWHITLSRWFNEYLFMPALVYFERKGAHGNIRIAIVGALYFVTFFLIGIWHGPNTKFLLVGLCLAATATGNFLWQESLKGSLSTSRRKALQTSPLYRYVANATTIASIELSLVFWWVPDSYRFTFFTRENIPVVLLGAAFVWLFTAAVANPLSRLLSGLERVEHKVASERATGKKNISNALLSGKLFLLVLFLYLSQTEPARVIYQDF